MTQRILDVSERRSVPKEERMAARAKAVRRSVTKVVELCAGVILAIGGIAAAALAYTVSIKDVPRLVAAIFAFLAALTAFIMARLERQAQDEKLRAEQQADKEEALHNDIKATHQAAIVEMRTVVESAAGKAVIIDHERGVNPQYRIAARMLAFADILAIGLFQVSSSLILGADLAGLDEQTMLTTLTERLDHAPLYHITTLDGIVRHLSLASAAFAPNLDAPYFTYDDEQRLYIGGAQPRPVRVVRPEASSVKMDRQGRMLFTVRPEGITALRVFNMGAEEFAEALRGAWVDELWRKFMDLWQGYETEPVTKPMLDELLRFSRPRLKVV
jgi:hypothetical protein